MDTAKEIYIGMDLGTFKTSVVSSTGNRNVLQSAVGWPKDHIARTMVGREVLFGEETVRQRRALRVIRPFARGALKYNHHREAGVSEADVQKHKEAARLLVQHAVSLTRPPRNSRILGVIGAPSRATVTNKQVLLEAAQGTFSAVMIASEPFTVAYGMNRLTNTLVIDIGAGTIDICVMYGAYPTDEDQVTVSIGGEAIDDRFLDQVKRAHPDARLSKNMARQTKEKFGFVHRAAERVLVTLPTAGMPRQFDVTDQLKEACTIIVPPIVDGLRELIARFDPEFQEPMLHNILLAGGGSQLKGLDRLIEIALEKHGGGSVSRVHDSVFAGADGALKLAMGLPPENWDAITQLDQPRRAA